MKNHKRNLSKELKHVAEQMAAQNKGQRRRDRRQRQQDRRERYAPPVPAPQPEVGPVPGQPKPFLQSQDQRPGDDGDC